MEDDSSSFHDFIPSTIGKKYIGTEDDLVELLWRDGHVVLHSQTSGRSLPTILEPKQTQKVESLLKSGDSLGRSTNLIQEDETGSWFQYSLDNSLGKEFSELLYGAPTCHPVVTDKSTKEEENLHSQGDVMPPPKPTAFVSPPHISILDNGASMHLSTIKAGRRDFRLANRSVSEEASTSATMVGVGESSSVKVTISSVCGSNRIENQAELNHTLCNVSAAKDTSRRNAGDALQADAYERVISSSTVGSGCRVGRMGRAGSSNHAQKRKQRDADESDAHSEETGYESTEANKPVQRPTSGRRSRAAEVHNLSERRRRDRINEKMRALQELIPHCNKSDKASMLDEAIEYLKSLQSQLQVMWMGSGMSPTLYMSRMCHGFGHHLIPSTQTPMLSNGHSMPTTSITNQPPVFPLQGPSHLSFPSQLHNFHLLEPYPSYIGFPQMHLPPQVINMCGNLQMVQNQVAAADKRPRACNKNSL